jgi:hypothetical protein
MNIKNNIYEKRISDLEKEISRLKDILLGKGKIVNFGKELHVDVTTKLSDIIRRIENLEKEAGL